MIPARRRRLLWIGGEPGSLCAAECASRELKLDLLDAPLSMIHRTQGRAVIIALDDGTAEARLNDELRVLLNDAACHGIKGYITCSYSESPKVAEVLKAWRMRDIVDVKLRGQEAPIIETIARIEHEPPASETLAIEGADLLSDEELILLKRSFGDCFSVKLVKQTTGSAKVYCAFASLLNSRVGPIPLPFFVKFDKAQKIIRELTNYRECTTLHVPFNQRPNLDHNRCLVGPTTGVIAGNFIEQSESLQEVVDRGAGRAPLHSLFEGALRGWRRQAFNASHYIIQANILQTMRQSRPSTYSLFRKARLRKRRVQNGQHCAEYNELESLLAALPPIKHRLGLTHGDLHGQNVRVAGHEAIMLDFASIENGPLTVDPAALDVSLMIDTRIVNGDDWIKVAEEAYKVEALMAPAIPPRPEDPSANLLDAIQYVRQMAFSVQLTPYEYPCVIALQLLRKASYGGTGQEQDRRRRFAYRLADRIIKDIARRMPAHVEHNVA